MRYVEIECTRQKRATRFVAISREDDDDGGGGSGNGDDGDNGDNNDNDNDDDNDDVDNEYSDNPPLSHMPIRAYACLSSDESRVKANARTRLEFRSIHRVIRPRDTNFYYFFRSRPFPLLLSRLFSYFCPLVLPTTLALAMVSLLKRVENSRTKRCTAAAQHPPWGICDRITTDLESRTLVKVVPRALLHRTPTRYRPHTIDDELTRVQPRAPISMFLSFFISSFFENPSNEYLETSTQQTTIGQLNFVVRTRSLP